MRRALLAVALVALASSPALAESDDDGDEGQKRDWIILLGAGVVYIPTYQGSDDYEVIPIPAIDVRYRDIFFASVNRGVGFAVPIDDHLRLGPLLNYRIRRDEDDDDDLEGLGDVKGALELGAFIEYEWKPVTFRAEVRQGVTGSKGLQAEMGVRFQDYITDDLVLSFGPGTTWSNGRYMDTYFGISPEQSIESGYPEFDADAGFKDVRLGAALNWSVTQMIGISVFGEYKRLLGDAADSPIVSQVGSDNQFLVGATVTFRFGFDM